MPKPEALESEGAADAASNGFAARLNKDWLLKAWPKSDWVVLDGACEPEAEGNTKSWPIGAANEPEPVILPLEAYAELLCAESERFNSPVSRLIPIVIEPERSVASTAETELAAPEL